MNYTKLISLGALIALAGYITSGPVGFLIVRFVKPQPAWTSPAVFALESFGLTALNTMFTIKYVV